MCVQVRYITDMYWYAAAAEILVAGSVRGCESLRNPYSGREPRRLTGRGESWSRSADSRVAIPDLSRTNACVAVTRRRRTGAWLRTPSHIPASRATPLRRTRIDTANHCIALGDGGPRALLLRVQHAAAPPTVAASREHGRRRRRHSGWCRCYSPPPSTLRHALVRTDTFALNN